MHRELLSEDGILRRGFKQTQSDAETRLPFLGDSETRLLGDAETRLPFLAPNLSTLPPLVLSHSLGN